MLEAPPLPKGDCSEPGCKREATAKGLCVVHYNRKKRRERKEKGNGAFSAGPVSPVLQPVIEKQEETESDAPSSDAGGEAISRKEVETLVVLTMGTLATFVDESFAVLDDKHELLPHANKAIDDMMPWMEKYAPSFAKWSPWIGLAMGVSALAIPAVNPTLEIIAGVRKPKFARATSDDIYTDAYKAAIAAKKVVSPSTTINTQLPQK